MAGLIPDADRLRLHLGPDEVAVLVSLLEGLADRVDSASDVTGGTTDPVIARLTPTVSRGDGDVDAELRSMLRDDLLEMRSQRLNGLVIDLRAWTSDPGGAVDHALDRPEAMRIVEVLNDVRLALATTVGCDDRLRESLGRSDARTDAVALMDALAWLQGGLIDFVEDGD